MYYKLNNDELKILLELEEKTCTDYEIVGNLVQVENLMAAIENLFHELENQEEKYKDLEQQIEDNYKPIPVVEQYGISDKDFM